jgi:prophage antirepressor-like protein
MTAQRVELQYKKHTLRSLVGKEGVWIAVADIARVLGYDAPGALTTRLPPHERDTRQMLTGPRIQVVSPAGLERIAGSSRKPGAFRLLDWFREEGMPQIALVLQDEAGAAPGDSLIPLESAASNGDPGRTFLYEALPVRMQMDGEGEILFRADDVCQALEMGNPRQAIDSHVDPEDVQKLDTLTAGGQQQVNYINISGLYALIFGSKKDAARKFKRWVTHDVLPAIQKTGSYSLGDAALLAGGQTPAQKLGARASQVALAASLSGAKQQQDTSIKIREELAQVNRAVQSLRGARILVDFHLGLDRPQGIADLPLGLDSESADKAVNGKTYMLYFPHGVRHPKLRAILSDEYLVKASIAGVKYLANQGKLSKDDWLDLEKLAQYKIRALGNKGR